MATRAQKYDIILALLKNPNEKISEDKLKEIKLSLNLKPELVELLKEGVVKATLTQYIENNEINNIALKLEIAANADKRLIKFLINTCVKPVKVNVHSYFGSPHGIAWNLDLIRLLQNIPVFSVKVIEHNELVNQFLSVVSSDNDPNFIYREFNKFSIEYIDKALRLNGLLSENYLSPTSVKYKALLTEDGYVISLNDGQGMVKTQTPLTVAKIIRMNQIDNNVRIAMVCAYLNGRTGNEIVYEDATKPTDPLTLFNQGIDELQAKHTKPEKLAKELILLCAKHLK